MKKAFSGLVFCLAFWCITAPRSYSQNISQSETLAYINEKLEGKCEVYIKKGNLYAEFYKNGPIYRKDQVLIDMLDPNTVVYNPEEKAVIVRCHEGEETCIYRKLYKNKINRLYNRINFIADFNEKSGNGTAKAFTHLIKLHQFPKYSSSELFE